MGRSGAPGTRNPQGLTSPARLSGCRHALPPRFALPSFAKPVAPRQIKLVSLQSLSR